MDEDDFQRALDELVARARRGGRIPLYTLAVLLLEQADVIESLHDNGAEV